MKEYLDGHYSLPRTKPAWFESPSGTVVAGVRCRGIALRDAPLIGKGPGLEMYDERPKRLEKGVGWAFGTCQNTGVAEFLPRESVHLMAAIRNHEWLPPEARKHPDWCWRSHFQECFFVHPPVHAGKAIGRGFSNMDTPSQHACLLEISKRPFWTTLKDVVLQGSAASQGVEPKEKSSSEELSKSSKQTSKEGKRQQLQLYADVRILIPDCRVEREKTTEKKTKGCQKIGPGERCRWTAKQWAGECQ